MYKVLKREKQNRQSFEARFKIQGGIENTSTV